MQFHQHTLPNGLQVIAELNPSVHSVAAGFFVRTGARDETEAVSGVSHFLEHMAFKGDNRISADDVNRIFDEVGANYNASTGEEVTIYYAAVLPEYLDATMELLSVMMQPSLAQEDFDMEKNVILEEIGMYDDLPSFTVYDTIMATHFAEHPLGRSVLGTKESVAALTSEQMQTYHSNRYRAGNMTLVVAGNTDFDSLLAMAEKHCGSIPTGQCERDLPESIPKQTLRLVTKGSIVQQHVMQMGPAPKGTDELRYAAELLSVVVGDDSGSRLFWELVDPGHVDSADVGYNEYDGAGTWMSYLGCQPDRVEENIAVMTRVFEEVNNNGILQPELEQAQNKVASRIVLRGERPMGRLSSLGGNWVYRKEYKSVADDLKTVRALSLADIDALLKQYPIRMSTTVGVGPREQLDIG
ncbi:MAG: pitrilysin family protein [Fuerstiella sp.]|jgi:predicted Zn-dependent peptidase|nr:pitrilysin family protein [Fuerstiella sp.]